MNAFESLLMPANASLSSAIDAACRSVAPTWPLDRFIAVNPYWGWIDQPIEEAADQLARLSGSRMTMPREFYRQAWASGQMTREHLAQALAEAGLPDDVESLVAALDAADDTPLALPLLSDVVDAHRDVAHEPAWRDTITHQVSQFCAAWFDAEQADWRPAHVTGLYADWRRGLTRDHSVALLMHAEQIAERATFLPPDARQAIAWAVERLGVAPAHLESFLRAHLLRINGWAAWCAYQRWQARLAGQDDNSIVELLAIRLCWECLLDDGDRTEGSLWKHWQEDWLAHVDAADPALRQDWLLQRALEIAYQQPLVSALAYRSSAPHGTPAAQTVFCIDVRSEVFRRALERAMPAVQTLGFAGFFGLPIDYTPLGTSATRPQLPGLLAPALSVTESCGDAGQDAALAQYRQVRLGREKSWRPFKRLPGSAFTLVESLGLGYLGKLVRRSLPSSGAAAHVDHAGLESKAACARPVLAGEGLSATDKAALAARVLRAMSLTEGLARLVLLVGHGSQSANNPHAAGLDCGACCGQTGEVNARALAHLLNDTDVRAALVTHGVNVPASTHFLPALHNTTTDEVALFDTDCVPESHADDLARIRQALEAAGGFARIERAASLGLDPALPAARLLQAVRSRANDWSQTRPEWGLANNAAFIVAPRARTRGLDLAGRSFLHDYDWRQDVDGSVLELIMTAPMVVTHWINMQYNASTVDNRHYGSGNKVLHNVVGGNIGVFEGNGGDLRIGLSLQSLHDGERWMHTPLRLSVFIEAPREAMESVIARHETVRHLLHHGWLHLFQIDSESGAVHAYRMGRWQAASSTAQSIVPPAVAAGL